MSGAAAHNASTGAEAASAPGRIRITSATPPRAMSGLETISVMKTPRRGGPPRWALAAAVSHSSRRTFVIPMRTSVTAIAWTIS